MKDVVAIIPARSGSKGVPNKNIGLLGGKPLIAYSIVAALKSKLINRVIVSTDSVKYAKIAENYGAEVPFLRPLEISGDRATDLQFFNHILNWMRKTEGYIPLYFAHLRPTTPFRNPKVIDEALQSFIGSIYYALRSVHKMSESSYKTFEIEDGKLKGLCDNGFNIEPANNARQTFPDTYNANGYIDIVRTELIEKKGIVHGDNVQAFVSDVAYEVDEVKDFEFMEYLIEKNPKIRDNLFG